MGGGCTYSCLADEALSQSIEVMEELLNADLSLEDLSLHALFHIELDVKNASWLGDAKTAQVVRSALSDSCRREGS